MTRAVNFNPLILNLEIQLEYQFRTNVALDKKFGISTVVTFQGWANIAESMSIKTPFSLKVSFAPRVSSAGAPNNVN